MRCKICGKRIWFWNTHYKLQTLEQSFTGKNSVVFAILCKHCAPIVMQVDDNAQQLSRDDERRVKFDK